MQKTAQQRGLFDEVSEGLHGITEKVPFLNPELKEIMDKLRHADDKARAIALAEKVGEEEPLDPSDEDSMSELIKKAASASSRREYMMAAAFLGRFHKKFADVSSTLKQFSADLTSVHEKFLIEGLDEDTIKHIRSLHKRMPAANPNQLPLPFKPAIASRTKEELVKIALFDGIKDKIHNIFNDRGRALRAWENRYKNQAGKLKNETKNMVVLSKAKFETLLKHFDLLSSYRNKRLIEKYEAEVLKVLALYKSYDERFSVYYNDHVKKWADKIIAMTPKEVQLGEKGVQAPSDVGGSTEDTTSKDTKSSKDQLPESVDIDVAPNTVTTKDFVGTQKVTKMPPNANVPLTGFQSGKQEPVDTSSTGVLTPGQRGLIGFPGKKDNVVVPPGQGKPVTAPFVPQPVTNTPHVLQFARPPEPTGAVPGNITPVIEPDKFKGVPVDIPAPKEQPRLRFAPPKAAVHNSFIKSLESFSSESPLVLKNYLTKYAIKIKDSDTALYNKIVNIINRIAV